MVGKDKINNIDTSKSSSLEDIQYHLYVLEKVKRGLERAASEGVVSHEDAKARLGKLLAA